MLSLEAMNLTNAGLLPREDRTGPAGDPKCRPARPLLDPENIQRRKAQSQLICEYVQEAKALRIS